MERDQRPRVARWHPRLASVCLLLLRILPGSAYDDKWREPEAEPVGLLHHTGEPTAPVSWWAEAGRGSEESSRGGSTPPQLTALGLGVKRVLVVALVGGVCVDDGWRGDLPRYLLYFLRGARAVVAHRDSRAGWTCGECVVEERLRHQSGRRDCGYYFGTGDARVQADLAIIIGLGSNQYVDPATGSTVFDPDMVSVFSSGLIGSRSRTILIPTRTMGWERVRDTFPVDKVLLFSDFVKPLDTKSIEAIESMCGAGKQETRDLIYVGRYRTGKGQLNFLEAVDWEDLVGYHIHFYGAGASELPEYVALLRKVASARRINATFHTLVDQAALLKHYCESVGQIHYPRGDANPRAPYEGIYAGNPLFVSEESHLNPAVYEQPFVVTVKSMCQEGFSGAFKEFMKLVRDQHKTVKMAQEFARKELKPYNTYRNICNMIGVCSP